MTKRPKKPGSVLDLEFRRYLEERLYRIAVNAVVARSRRDDSFQDMISVAETALLRAAKKVRDDGSGR